MKATSSHTERLSRLKIISEAYNTVHEGPTWLIEMKMSQKLVSIKIEITFFMMHCLEYMVGYRLINVCNLIYMLYYNEFI